MAAAPALIKVKTARVRDPCVRRVALGVLSAADTN